MERKKRVKRHAPLRQNHVNSKKSYRGYFIVLFLCFGAAIALFTSIVNYNLDVKNIKQKLEQEAQGELLRKRAELTSFTQMLEGYVTSLRNSDLLHDFIREPSQKSRDIVNSLFLAATNTNQAIMQLRYLDEKGHEKIRVDWHSGQQWPVIVGEDKLQDKSHRYYFVEASQVPANTFWYSRLDLNIENKKIEIPHKPVLRVASPVYVDQEFKGIVIINVHTKGFLARFQESSFFHICLVDGEGDFLVHFNKKYSWSRYLQTGHRLADEYPIQSATVLGNSLQGQLLVLGNLYAASMAPHLQKDQAHILFIAKKHAVQLLKHERKKATFLIVSTIFLLSVPLSLFISRIPAKLNEQIVRQNAILHEHMQLIDQNIITCSTDKAGTITEVSAAFAQVSGFTKDELVGARHTVTRHPDMADNFFTSMWTTIESGQTWFGEIKNVRKDGSHYWGEAKIFPKYDAMGSVQGYTAIYHDITDKKRIEELSITDELTGLYNRRFFNEIFEKEVRRSMRDKKMLTFAMLDVDHFKQYNDHYGHQKGDEVLAAIGQTLKRKLSRSSDFCFRLGGEEFGLLFSDLDSGQGLCHGETIRLAIENLAFEHQWSSVAEVVTISMGLLTITPGPGTTMATIYKQADQALYKAKKEGRNRIIADVLGGSI